MIRASPPIGHQGSNLTFAYIHRIRDNQIGLSQLHIQRRVATAGGCLLRCQQKRQGGDLDSSGIDVDAIEVLLDDGGRNQLWIRDRWFGGPAGLTRMLNFIEVHLVKKTKRVLAKVHRAARRVEQSDVCSALERLDFGRPQ